jgi:hypothetical protein
VIATGSSIAGASRKLTRGAIAIACEWNIRFKSKSTNSIGLSQTKFFTIWSLNDWVRNRAAIGANHAFNKHLHA